jgi:hypothetical protein
MAGEDTAAWKDLACAVAIFKVCKIIGGAIIKCSYESCVKVVNKSNSQSKTPWRVTLTCDSIVMY